MANYLDWEVGDSVQCIDGTNPNPYEGENAPIVSEIYTIREIVKRSWGIGLLLTELINERHLFLDGYIEGAYNIKYFRKLQKRKTDISQFQAMLNQTELTNKIELAVKERIKDVV